MSANICQSATVDEPDVPASMYSIQALTQAISQVSLGKVVGTATTVVVRILGAALGRWTSH